MNNVIALTDKNGKLTEEYTYTPYGNPINHQLSTINEFLFSGRRYDPESGLYYFRHRYYDSQLGRFITQEPMLCGDLFVNLVNNLNYARLNYLSLGNLKQIFKQRLDDLLRQKNLYQYAGNNPISQSDILGLHKGNPRPNPCGGVGSGAGGGGVPGVRKAVGVALIGLGVVLIGIDIAAGIYAGPFGIFVSGAFTGLGIAPSAAFYGGWSLLTSGGESGGPGGC